MLRERKRQAQGNLYVRGLSVAERDRISRAIETVMFLRPDEDAVLSKLLSHLDIRRFTLCIQITSEKLRPMPSGDLIELLRRYENGDNPTRMKWRRMCKKYSLSNKPVGIAADKVIYNRDRYITTRGKGKRIATVTEIIVEMHELDDETRDGLSVPEESRMGVFCDRFHGLLARLEDAC